MLKFIKDLLKVKNVATFTLENSEIITKELPLFDFSQFSNHTMIDVVIVPASNENDKIRLHLPQSLMDLVELKMDDHFQIYLKSNLNIITINGSMKAKIEVPANHLTNVSNYSMGELIVEKGVEVQQTLLNDGSGNMFVDYFSGHSIKNDSMGKIVVKNVLTNKLKVVSNGSGDLEIVKGDINTLDSHTESMGKVTIKAHISSAEVTSNGSGDTNIGIISDDLVVNLNSMGKVTIEGEIANNLKVSSSGSGNVVFGNINTKTVDLELSSMGKIEITGQSESCYINSSGSGDIKGNLSSLDFDISLNSMGRIYIEPLKVLKADIDGMGDLHLSGEHILDSVEANLDSMGKIKGGNITTRSLSVSGNVDQCNIQLNSHSPKRKM